MTIANYFRTVKSFFDVEAENIRRYEMPWHRRLWLYRHGILSSKDAIWDLSVDTIDQYLSDLEGLDSKIRSVDSPNDYPLDHKAIFPLIVSSTHDELLPDVYGIVSDGRIDVTRELGELRSFDELVSLLSEERVVAKPLNAAQGDGVRILDGRDDRLTVNGRDVSADELIDDLTDGRDKLLQEYVSQTEYAAEIYPDAANTVRVITMTDPDTHTPFIAALMHRFGTTDSGRIDNASTGGISAGIDVETGELRKALVPPNEGSATATWTDTHPDTGTRIAGTVIPGWDRVKDQVLDLAGEYGWLWPQVAWDAVVTDDQGTIALVEGNGNPGTKYIQAHSPMLADDRVRRFYEHHGVL